MDQRHDGEDQNPAGAHVSSALPAQLDELQRIGAEHEVDQASCEPFSMPSLDPLARQHSLLFEQSELLREQFLRFAGCLKQVHGMASRLHEQLGVEEQQRRDGEQRALDALATLRDDVAADRRKQELAARQVDERWAGLREEVGMQLRASDTELKLIGSRVESLASDCSAQLARLADRQRSIEEKVHAEVADSIRAVLEKTRSETALVLQELRGELRDTASGLMTCVQAEGQQQSVCLQTLERRLEEECVAGLQMQERQRRSSEDTLRSVIQQQRADLDAELSSLRRELLASFTDQVEAESHRRGTECEALSQCLLEHHQEWGTSLQEEETRCLAREAAFRGSGDELAESLCAAIEKLSSRLDHESDIWSGRMGATDALTTKLSVDIEDERKLRWVDGQTLSSDISEVRLAHLAEVESTAQLVTHCIQESSHMQRLIQEGDSAVIALDESLTERTRAMSEWLEQSVAEGWRRVADHAEMGREELWHVVNAVQERTTSVGDELQACEDRARQLEAGRLATMGRQLDECSALSSQVLTRFEELENLSLKENAGLATRLGSCAHDWRQTKDLVEALASKSLDYLESRDANFRLYITPEGNVAVFKRNDLGNRMGHSFQGVPCWHAGSGDRMLCSVNREMADHEKDRFLALANRGGLSV